MAEGSPVKESQCDRRREDIYDKIDKLQTEIDKMKGGIIVAKYVVPFMIAAAGFYADRKLEAVKDHLEETYKPRTVIEKVQPHAQDWEEKAGAIESFEETPPDPLKLEKVPAE